MYFDFRFFLCVLKANSTGIFCGMNQYIVTLI